MTCKTIICIKRLEYFKPLMHHRHPTHANNGQVECICLLAVFWLIENLPTRINGTCIKHFESQSKSHFL